MAASVLAGPGQRGKHEMLHILTTEISRVEGKISSDSKLKKMAELQSTVVTDSKNKQAFLDQVYMTSSDILCRGNLNHTITCSNIKLQVLIAFSSSGIRC